MNGYSNGHVEGTADRIQVVDDQKNFTSVMTILALPRRQ